MNMNIEKWDSREEEYVNFWRNSEGFPDPTAGAAMDRYFADYFKEVAKKKQMQVQIAH